MNVRTTGLAKFAVLACLLSITIRADAQGRRRATPAPAAPATTPRPDAAPAPTGDPAADNEARQHFERGIALIQQARWADAVVELQAARAVHAVPAVLFNLGVAHRALGHNLAAIEAFRSYLAGVDAAAVASRRAEVERYINDLQAGVGHITLAVTPPDATVTIDGASLATGTRTVEVDPGPHVLTATAAQYRSRQHTARVESGGNVTVTLQLERADVVVSGPPTGPIVTMGIGVLGLGVAAVFAGLRGGAFYAFEQRNCPNVDASGTRHCQPQSSTPDPDYTNGVSFTIATNVALGVGGAVFLAGAAWLLFGRGHGASEPSPRAARLDITPLPGGAILGLSFRGDL